MQLKMSPKPASHWDAMISKLNGNLFHSPQWADSRQTVNSRPLYFELQDQRGDCLGIALGIESWSPVPVIGKLSRQLEFETYPAVCNERSDLVGDMMQGIISRASGKGVRQVVFNSYMSRSRLSRPIESDVDIEERIEFAVDLTRPDDTLIANMSKHHKRKLKKARKHDLAFEHYQDLDAMQQFRSLQKQSRDRRLERGEEMAIMEDTYYEHLGKRYFANDLGTVFMLTHDGSPVSAAFVAHFGAQALYMYGGSSDKGFKMDAPPLLFTRIFAHCRERGCRTFNLGGVPGQATDPNAPSHGLYRFKAGFGGEQQRCENVAARNLNPRREKLLQLGKRLLGSAK